MASFVLGIVGLALLVCGWLLAQIPSLIVGILAIIFGLMAKREIAESPGIEGAGKAQAGFIMGIVATSAAGAWLLLTIIGLSIGAGDYYGY